MVNTKAQRQSLETSPAVNERSSNEHETDADFYTRMVVCVVFSRCSIGILKEPKNMFKNIFDIGSFLTSSCKN